MQFPCPHCEKLVSPQPDLVGALVTCRLCGGQYYEPIDPTAETRPRTAVEADQDVPMATLADAPVLSPAKSSSPAESPGEAVRSSAQPTTPTELRSAQVLKPYEAAGQKAVVISWTEGESRGAKVGSTRNCSKEDANQMILRVALKLIKHRCPDLHGPLSSRLDEEESSGS